VPTTRTRLTSAAAATAIIAGAALWGAPAALADGGYYGTWTLTAIKIGDKKGKCDGLPDEKDKCRAGMTLRLKANYRYSSTIKGLDLIFLPGTGPFVTTVAPATNTHLIVLGSDRHPDLNRAWSIKLQGTRYGAPQKMVLSASTDPLDPEGPEFKLIFRRDAK